MLNGDATTQRIRGGNLVGKRLAEKKTPEQIVEELYLRTVTRKPAPEEMQKLQMALAGEPDKQKALEDVFWALLNTREFLFNH
jgi:hypothetical protein